MDSGLVLRTPRNDAGAVNSGEKPNTLRILPARPYIHGRLARPCDSAKFNYALHAPIPRRAARPASGLGSRGAAREAEKGGARVQGAVALPAGEDAVLLRQR